MYIYMHRCTRVDVYTNTCNTVQAQAHCLIHVCTCIILVKEGKLEHKLFYQHTTTSSGVKQSFKVMLHVSPTHKLSACIFII